MSQRASSGNDIRPDASIAPAFTEHTIESAPPAARRFVTATKNHLGYLPAGVARMAASPQLLDGFLRLTAIFESSALTPVAREVVIMTVATRNGCHICVAMHTAKLTALGARPDLIAALRDAGPLPDEPLEAIRVFTLRVADTAGDVGDQALRDFLARGYTTRTRSRSCSESAPTRCPPWPTGSPARPLTIGWPPMPGTPGRLTLP